MSEQAGGHLGGSVEEALGEARRKYRNWGRWGVADALGTLNYIDDGKRAAAARLARTGRAFSLAVELNSGGPRSGLSQGNPVHTMLDSGLDAAAGTQGFPHGFGDADDVMFMPLRSGTHWDGLGHVYDNKQAWNGRYCADVTTGAGDQVTGAERQAAAFVSRGVLLDAGRALGAGDSGEGELPGGFAITEDQLRAVIAAQGPSARIGRGDIVLIRTGQLSFCRRLGAWEQYAAGPAPGLSFGALGWLHGTEIAAVATDTFAVEVRPHEFAPPCHLPLHQIAIPNMGLFLGEMFELEALAADCAADGRYEFLLVAGGLPVTGGVGAPVNPIAVKLFTRIWSKHVRKADFDTYIARFNEEDPGAFETYMAPDVRMLNGTLELNGVDAVKAHYARIWGAMREELYVERFVSDESTVAIQMHTHFVVRAGTDDSPFGQVREGETFDFHGLIMYRLGEDGRFADIKVAYLSFIYTDVDGTAKDLGIPH